MFPAGAPRPHTRIRTSPHRLGDVFQLSCARRNDRNDGAVAQAGYPAVIRLLRHFFSGQGHVLELFSLLATLRRGLVVVAQDYILFVV